MEEIFDEEDSISKIRMELEIKLKLECQFCGRRDGKLFNRWYPFLSKVWLNHYEQHLATPRRVDICQGCHVSLHRYLTIHSKERAEELLNKREWNPANYEPLF